MPSRSKPWLCYWYKVFRLAVFCVTSLADFTAMTHFITLSTPFHHVFITMKCYANKNTYLQKVYKPDIDNFLQLSQ